MTTPPGPTRSAAGLRERKRAQTRSELARAAFTLARERGVDGFTIDEVAETTGVSRRTFFNHFSGKEEAISHVVAMSVHTSLADLVHPGATAEMDECAVIDAFSRTDLLETIAHVTRALLDPGLVTLFRQFADLAEQHPSLLPHVRQVEAQAREDAARLLANPSFGALDPFVARLVPGVVVSALSSVILRETQVREIDGSSPTALTTEELVARLVTFLTTGIGAPAPPGPAS
ncbi:TetR/AcrR family transcriptional regulator [Ruania suaedae]|uniref:TetR/AcrR family transcriptional regulator n=1 Tax=Ruania suaedae TaxID=2897774 RepID=UPI001E5D17FE|nr:TetR/AcrR family transcriptional regulator [Ruania suaedae]UFU04104.1 TetR/AcrR family transcriptional regulator [Ruania suaedae]